MILVDVNVLVDAHRLDASGHAAAAAFLDGVVNGDQSFGLSDLVASGFLRVVTSPRVFKTPTPMPDALRFVETIRGLAHCVAVNPGPRHWEIFTRLCRESSVRGPLVTDAWLAALAIESGCEWVTSDGDFGRFRDLKWRRPQWAFPCARRSGFLDRRISRP